MQPDRVERIKFLLAAAHNKSPAERQAYLDAACMGDPDLRRDVEQYLFTGEKTEQFSYRPDAVETLEETARITTDPKAGKRFGKYTIQKRLAEGGMGVVYLAVDNQLGREVALKILPEFFILDKDRLSRFHREARATSLLNHPNIVTVFELGQIDDCEFIVTEFVEGETLRAKIDRGQIPFVEMIKIASQVASALAAAHKAGIVHRDIKPENVMIRPDGYVKVLDFGLAKLSDAMGQRVSGGGSMHNRTVPGMIMGTAAYMSPEQAEGTDVDARTDIWALGVMLYEMACGKVPFEGPTPSHTIVAILEHDPSPYEHPSVELRQIITTALQKDRQLRFQTAEAMVDALDAAKHRLGYISDQHVSAPPAVERVSERVSTPRVVAAKKPPSSSRKYLWLIPAALAVLVIGTLGVLGVAALLFRSTSAANSNSSAPVAAAPSPTPTVVTIAVPDSTATPMTTPENVYVEPTPEPTVNSEQRSTVEPVQRDTIRKTTARVAPTPTPVRADPKPAPTRKPKVNQDPNCVFTNSCH